MLDNLMSLDDYDRATRLVPGLLIVLPIGLVLIGLGVRDSPLAAALAALAVTFGTPLLLAKHVRRRGRTMETRLKKKWGGLPTTVLLVPDQDGSINALCQQRRNNLERISGVKLPLGRNLSSSDEESFEAAMRTLRAKTADHDAFKQVYAENKNYGFERNIKGIRAEGLIVSGISVVALATLAALSWDGRVVFDPWPLTVTGCLALVMVFFWLAWPTSDRVRDAGIIYAERVLDAAERLPDADARS